MTCIDHLNYCGKTCPDCGLEVDEFGNTEEQFDRCSFPCCGCDGAQHCMAGDPNVASMAFNFEKGSLNTRRTRR